MKRFPLEKNYSFLLESHGVSTEEVLRRARLPQDLFLHETPSVSAQEYYRFMEAIDDLVTDADLPIRLATADNIEALSPPLFAAYCSENAGRCIKRIAQYKALVGAVAYKTDSSNGCFSVAIEAEEDSAELPEIVVGVEMVLLVNLIRKATKINVVPCKVTVKHPFGNPNYEKFLGIVAERGERNELTFTGHDASIPFVTRNESMWSFFEPELRKRLSELDTDDTVAARVRSALVELLPSGECSADDVCRSLGMSRRTLQRKLKDEGTSFQQQLNHTRELLTKNYLGNTKLSSEDIAYLIGYQDINSFYRAFTLWTGKTISEYKEEIVAQNRKSGF